MTMASRLSFVVFHVYGIILFVSSAFAIPVKKTPENAIPVEDTAKPADSTIALLAIVARDHAGPIMYKDNFHGWAGSWLNKFPSTVQGCADLCPGSEYITYAVHGDKNCRCLGGNASGFVYAPVATYKIGPQPYATKTITWGSQDERACAWQCSCHGTNPGCDSEDKCVRYKWTQQTKKCELFDTTETQGPHKQTDMAYAKHVTVSSATTQDKPKQAPQVHPHGGFLAATSYVENLRPVLKTGVAEGLLQLLTSSDFKISLNMQCTETLEAPATAFWNSSKVWSWCANNTKWGDKFGAEVLIPQLIQNTRFEAAPNEPAAASLVVLYSVCYGRYMFWRHPKDGNADKRTRGSDELPGTCEKQITDDKPHFYVLPQDYGPCDWHGDPFAWTGQFSNDFLLTSYGVVEGSTAYSLPQPDAALEKRKAVSGDCFNQSRDIVVPTSSWQLPGPIDSGLDGSNLENISNHVESYSGEQARPQLAFAQGSTYFRVALKGWAAEASKGDIVFVSHMPHDTVLDNYLKTKFCLHADGNAPWSPRLMEYLAAGCVPVIVSDALLPPLSRALNWDTFSVRISPGELRNLEAKLRELVRNGGYLKLHQALLRVREALTYDFRPAAADFGRGVLPLLMYEMREVVRLHHRAA